MANASESYTCWPDKVSPVLAARVLLAEHIAQLGLQGQLSA